jgi:ubiquinone biosynthesis accessory factor UbiJ
MGPTRLIEAALNRGLPRSMRARELCAELNGRRLAVEVTGVGTWLLSSDGLTLHLEQPTPPVTADASLRCGLVSLLRLATSGSRELVQRGLVELSGDAEVAQAFQELGERLRPDLEEELSLVLGDVPAHQLARFAGGLLDWGAQAARTGVQNVGEYLAHERGDLVSRPEAEAFFGDVDGLREDLDRLAARLALLGRAGA